MNNGNTDSALVGASQPVFLKSSAQAASLEKEQFSQLSPSIGKSLFDRCGALLLLAFLSPVLLLLSLLVLSSGRQIIFRQTRIGLSGKMFSVYKFRTMIPDAEAMLVKLLADDPELQAEYFKNRKLRRDPRVTRIGTLLRRTSLDELPQLLNVLRGEMSLIGPRPLLPGEIEAYGKAIRCYCSVRPGMTGLWQVSGRASTNFRRRVALDTYYIRHRSAKMDLAILVLTVRVVLTGHGAY